MFCSERVCYKTTIVHCADGYQVYLNLRNSNIIQSSRLNETDQIPFIAPGVLFLQSPHYDRFYRYRRNEFCIYDISLPDCPSERVVVDNALHYTQLLEQRHRYNVCSDYLQFFMGSSVSEKYCNSELSRLKLEIPQTRFQAVFWTDTSINRKGFKLRVSCANHLKSTR